MKAIFIGTNGSMGFIEGKSYDIQVVFNSYLYPIIITAIDDKGSDIRCPYNSLELLFDNWEFESIINKTHIEIEYKTFKRIRCNGDLVKNNTKDMVKGEKYLAIAIVIIIIFMAMGKWLIH